MKKDRNPAEENGGIFLFVSQKNKKCKWKIKCMKFNQPTAYRM